MLPILRDKKRNISVKVIIVHITLVFSKEPHAPCECPAGTKTKSSWTSSELSVIFSITYFIKKVLNQHIFFLRLEIQQPELKSKYFSLFTIWRTIYCVSIYVTVTTKWDVSSCPPWNLLPPFFHSLPPPRLLTTSAVLHHNFVIPRMSHRWTHTRSNL